MLKVIYFTSEKKNNFGVYKVVNILRERLNKEIDIKITNNIFDIFFSKPQDSPN